MKNILYIAKCITVYMEDHWGGKHLLHICKGTFAVAICALIFLFQPLASQIHIILTKLLSPLP